MEQVLRESMDNSHGPGIGLTAGLSNSTAAITQLTATNALHKQPLTTQQLPPTTSTILHHPPMSQGPSTTTVPIVAAPNHPPTAQQISTAAVTQLAAPNGLLQQPLTMQQLPPTTQKLQICTLR